MTLLGALVLAAGFIGLIKVFGLVEKSRRVLRISRSALSILGDKSLGDLQKEKELQKSARELLGLFLAITGTTILALGIPLGLIWILDRINLVVFGEVIRLISSPGFILAAVGLSLIYLAISSKDSLEGRAHSQGERTLHGLAFETWFPRVPLSRLESRLYHKQLAGISSARPVFITALPRAGTTLLLKLCLESGEFASHTYREMPFLLSPLLWERLSGRSRDPGALAERVHGDGIQVNLDSPESFEEILWKEFWPSYYQENRILPWGESAYPEFEGFFRDHMRKVILLRGQGGSAGRYISKNNLNIARIAYLKKTFPESRILVLFRDPLQQAASLRKQHLNFLEIHEEDPFARQFMQDTGHYDFGENLRPVDFGGWLKKEPASDPESLEFWLQYWIHAYQHLLQAAGEGVALVSFDALCLEPMAGMEKLAALLELNEPERLLTAAVTIRPPKVHQVGGGGISPEILAQAEGLHSELQANQI